MLYVGIENINIRHERKNTSKNYLFTPDCGVVAADWASTPIVFQIFYVYCCDMNDISFNKFNTFFFFFWKIIIIISIKCICGHFFNGTLLSIYLSVEIWGWLSTWWMTWFYSGIVHNMQDCIATTNDVLSGRTTTLVVIT